MKHCKTHLGRLGLAAVLALAGFGAAPAPVRAAELSAQAIVDRSLENNAFGFQNALAQLTLRLFSKKGSERVREIEIRSREKDERKRTLVRFQAPADVAGTGFLMLENDDRDDDQYLYLPAIGKVKRISGNQRQQRFMGTDLTHADLESRSLRKGNLERLPDAAVGGSQAYVIASTPKEGDDSQYGKTVTWIHQSSFVPLRIEFYDRQLELLKVLTVHRLEKKDGNWVVMDSTIKNEQAGTSTQMTVRSIDFKAKLEDAEFTERALGSG